MASADLTPWSGSYLPSRYEPGQGSANIVRSLLRIEEQFELHVMERYYWMVDVAPILLSCEVRQRWRDTKRAVGYLADDLWEALDAWLG